MHLGSVCFVRLDLMRRKQLGRQLFKVMVYPAAKNGSNLFCLVEILSGETKELLCREDTSHHTSELLNP